MKRVASIELPPLPRVTSYGSEDEMPIAQDFYRRTAPFMGAINKWLEGIILALGVVGLLFLLFIGLAKTLTESYVTDGVNACVVTPAPAPKVVSK